MTNMGQDFTDDWHTYEIQVFMKEEKTDIPLVSDHRQTCILQTISKDMIFIRTLLTCKIFSYPKHICVSVEELLDALKFTKETSCRLLSIKPKQMLLP